VCFALAGFFAAIFIFSGVGQLVVPPLLIVAYGLLLLSVQRSKIVRLSGTLKDSPYFLGFILTLTALFHVLHGIDLSKGFQGLEGSFAAEVSGAILTTAVGLFFRQLLLSADRSEEDIDAEFHRLADKIRQDTVEFHQAQELLTKFILEFVKAQEANFTREQRAFKRYIEHLESSETALLGFIQDFPARTNSFVNDFRALGGPIKTLHDDLVTLLSEQSTAYATTAQAFRSQIDELSSAVKNALTDHAEHLKQFDKATQQGIQLATTFATSAKDADGAISQTKDAVTELNDNLKQVAQEIGKLPDETRDALKGLGEAANEARQTAKSIKSDVEQIDRIVDEIVNALSRRMSAPSLVS